MTFKNIISNIVAYIGYPVTGILTIVSFSEDIPEPFFVAVGILAAATTATISLRKDKREREELELLEMAAIRNGRFTLVEAALELKRPIKKIKKQLRALEEQGAIGYEIADSGELFYRISNTAALQMRNELNASSPKKTEDDELWFDE